MFGTYVVVLVVAGVVLIGLALSLRELGYVRRTIEVLSGAGYLGYAGFLIYLSVFTDTENFSVYWAILVWPVLLLIDGIRAIDVSDVEGPRFDYDDEPSESASRRSTVSQERRAARREAALAAIREKHTETEG
ncbi:hypothetical protein [Nocardia sp. XZ_19_385]|uniref:hypothetical protein n=1 Tax=Nocardia sp. XZ_19_385 TaxID=2769488 RepID=UPI00188E8942|nr:hypothetical protein [Nocardia sp. XZ_19_385]